MKPHFLTLAALAALAALAPALQAQVAIPESVALPSSAVDKTKPGFKVRVHQATLTLGEFPNTLARAEAQLAGLWLKPDGTPYENIAEPSLFNPDGTYDEPGFIAYTADAFPGIPGTESTTSNIALEAITYADLQPGTYSMIVNSDDGFRVTTGDVRDRTKELVLGLFDGGRGVGDTVFNFTVSKAGVYPFRLVYMQGGGGYAVDWFTADPADPAVRVHLNEDGGIRSYRSLTAGTALPPAIVALSPAQGAVNVSPSTPFTAVIEDGSTVVTTASVTLARGATDVTSAATITKTGKRITVTYAPATLADPLAKEEYTLTFDDATAAGGKRVAEVSFTVAAYANFALPAPLWFEGFDTIEENTLPTGWTTFSPMDPTGIEDLDDPNSDNYRVFVVISKERVQNLSTRWDSARRLNYPEAYINGKRITSLINTNFAYHESDVRGGSQYAELISPSINLTGKTDVHLVYHSIYEQNQDNIAGTEYSIDDGTTWLPVVYMVDSADLVKRADDTTDADGTLNAARTDTAQYTDPETGQQIGLTYGAFVKSDITKWKDYDAFISGRVNDDANESKRIEKFRLPQADNQAKVRLRFFQAGTGSWYYGVDEIGLYSITTIDPPTLTAQPSDLTRLAGVTAAFTVGASGQQLSYQWQKDGANLPGATNATLGIPSAKVADAGKYRVRITNPGGPITSGEATLTVLPLPGDTSTHKTGLGVHLKFDGNLNDASGNNRNGTAVGAPELTTGLVGTGAVRVKSTRDPASFNIVTLGSNADLPFGATSDFTVAYWARTERVTGDPGVVGNKNWGAGGNVGWVIGTQTDGRLEWNYRRVNPDSARRDLDFTTAGLAANVWRHVVVVFGINGDAVSYVDGVVVNRQSIAPGTGDIADPALALNIGQDGTGAYTDGEWDGLIDDFAIWTRALTGNEVATIFGLGLSGTSLDGTGGSGPAPSLTFTVAGGQLTLAWTGSGFVLEENTALGTATAWTPVAGAGANSATVPTTGPAKYYQLKK